MKTFLLHSFVRPAFFTLLASLAAPLASPAAPDPAKPAHALTTCVVSGEPLEGGDMGGPVDYIHKEAGKPDRLVRFCCESCIRKFKKDPAKYLAKLDAASTGKAAHDHSAGSSCH